MRAVVAGEESKGEVEMEPSACLTFVGSKLYRGRYTQTIKTGLLAHAALRSLVVCGGPNCIHDTTATSTLASYSTTVSERPEEVLSTLYT